MKLRITVEVVDDDGHVVDSRSHLAEQTHNKLRIKGFYPMYASVWHTVEGSADFTLKRFNKAFNAVKALSEAMT